MDLGFKGRIALVAAASQGLGRAVAEELAAEGASLVICARGKEALDQAAGEIREKTGATVLAVAADVSKPSDVSSLVEAGLNRFERIDILVTNAGGPPTGRFETLPNETWETAIRLTLFSTLELTRLVLPGMKEHKWGRILNITSIAVKQPIENLMLSNSIRAAVTGFARTLANEVAEFGITVNNIMPGYTRTERVVELAETLAIEKGINTEDVMQMWEKEIPMKRLGQPREFAALAAFLVSERASYITGTSIQVDGGWIKSIL